MEEAQLFRANKELREAINAGDVVVRYLKNAEDKNYIKRNCPGDRRRTLHPG